MAVEAIEHQFPTISLGRPAPGELLKARYAESTAATASLNNSWLVAAFDYPLRPATKLLNQAAVC